MLGERALPAPGNLPRQRAARLAHELHLPPLLALLARPRHRYDNQPREQEDSQSVREPKCLAVGA